MERQILAIVDMGFSESDARRALEGNDFDFAVELLVSGEISRSGLCVCVCVCL